MNRVFLGGTCNGSDWRDTLIKAIQVGYFNPVVDDWDEGCQAIERNEKELHCNIHLYVITKEMTGMFSIAEAVESSLTAGKATIFHVMPDGFTGHQIKSFKAVCNMITKHGGIAYIDNDLMRTARVINYCYGGQD